MGRRKAAVAQFVRSERGRKAHLHHRWLDAELQAVPGHQDGGPRLLRLPAGHQPYLDIIRIILVLYVLYELYE